MEYKIVSTKKSMIRDKAKEEIENEANKLIKQGFIPLGGINTTIGDTGYSMFQAMIKQ